MSALLVEVKLDGALGGPPAVDQPRAAIGEERIIGGQGHEHRWRVGRRGHGGERAIDQADEGGLGVVPRQGGGQGQHRAGGKADHANAVRVDLPFSRPLPDERERRARVGDLRGQARHRGLWIRPRPLRGGREHLGHRALEGRHVRRCLIEPVFEHEGGHALVGERAGDIPALVLHRQGAKSAAGRDDDRRARRLGRIRQERRQRRHRDVASEGAAILAVPGFRRGRARQDPRVQRDRVRLGGDGHQRHLVILRVSPSGQGQRQDCGPQAHAE
jgi:hypothetical protein